ncbi:allophanate hydrolase subunit 1 [Rhodococcus triatomae]|uniref:5-oxoprolinase subunit B family protein n=1 Tax=Rhodococcus triatomae TaxID=300028 RepID=UPI00093413DD|nr:allophanate hydrolase subunit 1 [Rhodococcus triatomae]QNG21101.1 allophanate hydrolase subunit 1 [Rhodococcus triatomae]QNG25607.1 allophanate hydrolase subunit 1 [Rhodococcus triatomae]
MRLRDVGRSAILAEFEDLDTVLGYFRALDADPVRGVQEIVPASRTLLVRYDPAQVTRDSVGEWITGATALPPPDPGEAEEVQLAVRYDGPDLADVAEHTGLSVDEVVRAHTGTPWIVAFAGFAPGFGYLVDGDPRLRVPRRAEPRTAVPAGAVAVAGEFSGVYPRSSPGGWQLIGTTDTVVWDPEGTPPALLRPGVRVRFTAM